MENHISIYRNVVYCEVLKDYYLDLILSTFVNSSIFDNTKQNTPLT